MDSNSQPLPLSSTLSQLPLSGNSGRNTSGRPQHNIADLQQQLSDLSISRKRSAIPSIDPPSSSNVDGPTGNSGQPSFNALATSRLPLTNHELPCKRQKTKHDGEKPRLEIVQPILAQKKRQVMRPSASKQEAARYTPIYKLLEIKGNNICPPSVVVS